MNNFDPLEETQENLHPVIVAHRARDADGAPRAAHAGSGGRLRFATLGLVIAAAAVLFWLCLPAQA